MKFGSVCSGIEAASVAWHPLGWRAAWLAEIEPFPSAVLAHHYPDVPNFGDMTKLPDMILSGRVEAPDVFCGGTPCQAFSVAGLRRSLDDARGNLSLTFCEVANAIDTVRYVRGEQPAIVFWENVPGVLSTNDNAFGCFLAQLCGGSEPLVAPNGWTNAGCVSGPKRTVAWRVLDAQYFGLAQRRRRVFVVASARNDFDPAAVLFEFDGVRRDTAPSREAGESVAGTFKACASSGGWSNSVDHAAAGYMQPVGCEFGQSGGRLTDLSPTLDTTMAKYMGYDNQHVNAGCPLFVPAQPNTGVKYAHYSHDYAHDRITSVDGVNPALTKEAHASGNLNVAVPIAFHPTQTPISSTDGTTHGLGCGSSRTGQASIAVAQPYTLAIRGRGDTHQLEYRQDGTANALLTPNGGRGGSGVGAVGIFQQSSMKGKGTIGYDDSGVAKPVKTQMDGQMAHIGMAVRRLTPVECERLQGFPDDYTQIPWRKKPASECPDGPRYKALGNSWAVPCVTWIGRRIDQHLRMLDTANDNRQQPGAEAAA